MFSDWRQNVISRRQRKIYEVFIHNVWRLRLMGALSLKMHSQPQSHSGDISWKNTVFIFKYAAFFSFFLWNLNFVRFHKQSINTSSRCHSPPLICRNKRLFNKTYCNKFFSDTTVLITGSTANFILALDVASSQFLQLLRTVYVKLSQKSCMKFT